MKQCEHKASNTIAANDIRKRITANQSSAVIRFFLRVLEIICHMLNFKELPITANDKFLTAWQNIKASMLSWHWELLTEAYGEQIDHIKWDVVTTFRGMLLQHLSYAIQKVIAVPMEELREVVSLIQQEAKA